MPTDLTITGHSAAAALDGTEATVVDQAGATKKATLAQIWTVIVNAQTGTTYTVVDGDRRKLVTHTNAAAIAVTLPQAGAASSFLSGWFCWFENRGVGTVTITPTTSTIDGAASIALATGQGLMVASDGTNYFTSRGMGLSLGLVNVFTKNQSVTPVTLTDAATVAVDASLSNNFKVVLGGNRTLGNPTNLTDGMVLNFKIKQDGTGSRTLAYGSKYKWAAGTAPVLSTAINAIDFISAYYDSTDDILIGAFVKGLA